MARYVVIDWYDYQELLLETDDLNKAYAAALQRMADTDGECDISIRDTQTAPFPNNCGGLMVAFFGEDEDED